MTRDSRTSTAQRKLLADCLILLVSLVLTDPNTTKRQQAMIGKLIKRLKKEIANGS